MGYKGIYRSSIIYENGTYYLYYTGISKKLDRDIGLSYGKDITNLKGYNIKTDTIDDLFREEI